MRSPAVEVIGNPGEDGAVSVPNVAWPGPAYARKNAESSGGGYWESG
jgi:hypothetical protein